MKIGRNDPCPCGSGKKYKKCCMNKDVSYEEKGTPEFLKRRWTDEKVERMSTTEIFDQLATLGIEKDEDEFIREITAHKSSDALALVWEETYHLDINDLMIDFVYIAVRILASRLALGHLLIENLNSKMQDGYKLLQENQRDQACDLWWEVWEDTFRWLIPRHVDSINELDNLTKGDMLQSYHNWVQDFEMALERLGSKGKKYLQMRYDLGTQFRKRLPESSSLIMLNMGTAAAEALFQLGKVEEADKLFEKIAKENPDDIWPLVRWGDMYTTWMNKENADHHRARELYEKALQVAEDESDRETIEMRIEDLNIK
ncbi:SEC-C metal-binding domain-containing protein [Camelliibacillus cellulosilyticus]|uniref:SEC-C metal-binding domain-containing protein n=1 Tax=Camelliibacillus cellulosilyticus TaxID=2174486 RepID=A0ABV9GMV0_9BACL